LGEKEDIPELKKSRSEFEGKYEVED